LGFGGLGQQSCLQLGLEMVSDSSPEANYWTELQCSSEYSPSYLQLGYGVKNSRRILEYEGICSEEIFK
jgi:hypothetical protein